MEREPPSKYLKSGEALSIVKHVKKATVPRVLHADEQDAEDAKIRCRSHLKHKTTIRENSAVNLAGETSVY